MKNKGTFLMMPFGIDLELLRLRPFNSYGKKNRICILSCHHVLDHHQT